MTMAHNTSSELHRETPLWFTVLAWLLPIGLFVQFVNAGFGLFLDTGMLGFHAMAGMAVMLLPVALLAGALAMPRLRSLGWWAGLALVLYVVQIGLAAGASPVPLSLHPANGALLLIASLVLLFKVERRRRAATPK